MMELDKNILIPTIIQNKYNMNWYLFITKINWFIQKN
jgi:hypothetical protein